jgi:integrase/recombinase XerC
MEEHLQAFLDHLRLERGASAHTIKAYREDLTALRSFLTQSAGSANSSALDLATTRLRAYLADLHQQGLAKATIARRLASLRTFLKFLCREGVLRKDPSVGLRTPKKRSALPGFLSTTEIESLLEAPDTSTRLGARDRAIFETFYSTGLRVSELVGMNLADLNRESRLVVVRGKGKRERIALLGAAAIRAIEQWLEVRGQAERSRPIDRTALFLNHRGGRISPRSVARILGRHLKRAGVTTRASPHTLRHSFATHMLDRGADVRSVQELLGHRSLSSTQIYTHVTSQRMRDVYDKSHPRA